MIRIKHVCRGLGVAAVLVSSTIGLAACGSGDSSVAGTSPATTAQKAPPVVAPAGPKGALSETSFGSVEQGMEISEVVELWGKPDIQKRFPGCELNPDARDNIVSTWYVPDGEVLAAFDAETRRLVSYRTSSRSYPTRSGVRVGDSFAVLKGSEGTALMPLSLGATSTAQNGYWYTGDPARAEQLFSVAGGKVTMISGGYLPACE